ncbi:protein GPR108-like [Sinocyclocheilus rhinocerous]|uniref:Protein GPR108-like n=1 Tax=Sinocyclocheilus rhinocerous TaxID=307959 RepID=A0A673J991_9TELE|nr:PREDICTED: protein GPR108-like [Sinocyclocheilus rhinocerous]
MRRMRMMMKSLASVMIFILTVSESSARIHQLKLKNETRFLVHLNSFGYFANGTLDVSLVSLNLPQEKSGSGKVGFSLARTRVNGILSYTAQEVDECKLLNKKSENELILFIIDTEELSVQVKHFGHSDITLVSKLKPKTTDGGKARTKRENAEGEKQKEPSVEETERKENSQEKAKVTPAVSSTISQTVESLDGMSLELQQHDNSFNFSFRLTMSASSQGLYNLDFHNCLPAGSRTLRPYSLHVEITEKNPSGYLSAAEIPLPRLYISMATVFFAAAVVWTYTLLKYRYSVFKIHWLMAALAYTKAVSLLFHSINYHFINSEGHPIEGWAVMYYITHLLKGALLFITLALIGTGFAFVKYILSDKEKKIFMIVIPLQVLANVSYIIIEETEEGTSEYALWREILFLVDLLCCGAVLFPVVWSIRHLQEASNTDGKAAMNLEKLKLFRHYYVMIVCYIYFTRIIAILLQFTVPFQWQWCQEFLVEVSTLIFFVLTGFKFRPASNNPYLQLPQDEEDLEMDEVITESGALEGIHKVKKTSNGRERQREVAL